MKHGTTSIYAVGALSLAHAVGACGNEPTQHVTEPVTTAATTSAASSAPTPPSAPKPASHEQVTKKLKSTCRQGNREIQPYRETIGTTADWNASADAFDGIRGVLDRSIEKLEALRVPAEDEEAFGRYVKSLKRQEGLTARQVEALREQDAARVEALSKLTEENRDQRVIAAIDLGSDCGR